MDVRRIKARIADIASRPKNVRFEELETLLDNHIGPLFKNYNHHGHPHHAFTIGGNTFNVAQPHGGGFVKKRYIEFFLEAMEAVGFYDPGAKDEPSEPEPDPTGKSK